MAVGLRVQRIPIRVHRRRRRVAAVGVSHQRRVRQVLRRRGLVRGRPGVDAKPLAQDGGVEEANSPAKRLKPKELKAYLDEHIIGQEAAKKAISVAVYKTYKEEKQEQRPLPIQNCMRILTAPYAVRSKQYLPDKNL